MAVATRRTPALGSPRSSDEPVSDTEPYLEYHGDTSEPISADWRRTLATSREGGVVTSAPLAPLWPRGNASVLSASRQRP